MSAMRLRVFDPSSATPIESGPPTPTEPAPGRTTTRTSGEIPRREPADSPAETRQQIKTGGDIIRRYLDSLARRCEQGLVSKTHLANYRRSLDVAPRNAKGESRYTGFIEVVGNVLIGELIQDDLERWIEMNESWTSPDSRRNNSAAAIACFNWAAKRGLLKPSPYCRTDDLTEELVTRRDATDEENAAIWATAELTLRRIIWLIDRAGLRTCEARELLWEWIDWDRATIRFDKHKTSRRQKKKEPRIVGLDADTLAELRRWHGERREGQRHVFLTPGRAVPWSKNRLGEVFRATREKAGLPDDLTPYCFRHRYCTQSRLSGAPVAEVSAQMGHTTERMTDHYTHFADKPEHAIAVAAAAKAAAELVAAARAARSKRKEVGESLPLFEGLD